MSASIPWPTVKLILTKSIYGPAFWPNVKDLAVGQHHIIWLSPEGCQTGTTFSPLLRSLTYEQGLSAEEEVWRKQELSSKSFLWVTNFLDSLLLVERIQVQLCPPPSGGKRRSIHGTRAHLYQQGGPALLQWWRFHNLSVQNPNLPTIHVLLKKKLRSAYFQLLIMVYKTICLNLWVTVYFNQVTMFAWSKATSSSVPHLPTAPPI